MTHVTHILAETNFDLSQATDENNAPEFYTATNKISLCHTDDSLEEIVPPPSSPGDTCSKTNFRIVRKRNKINKNS